MYQAGIYCRISREERTKKKKYSNSIDSQTQMAREFIAGHNDVEEVRVYADDGVSGNSFDRAEFRKMLEDIERGIINMVILKDVSRLGRERIDTAYYLWKYFPERKLRVVALLDHYDSAVCTYDALLEIKTLLNDMYLRDISKKIRTAILAKRITGEYTPPVPPFGYVKSKIYHNHLVADPFAAGIVARIFRMYIRGFGGTRISRILNEEGIPAPAKYKKEILKDGYPWKVGTGLWTPDAVRKILGNPVYTGAVVTSKFDNPSDKPAYRKAVLPEERELIPDAHEAIVSREEFEQVQQIKRGNRVPYFSKNRKPHKYAGILFCGKCRMAMSRRYLASHNGYDGYVCGFHQKMGHHYCELNHIAFERLDELVAYSLNQQIKQVKSSLDHLRIRLGGNKSKTDEKILRIKTKIERNMEYRKQSYEQFMDEIISREEYLARKKIYNMKNDQYRQELCRLINREKDESAEMKDTVKWLDQFCCAKITSGQLTKKILDELIDRIDVFPDRRVDIYFKFTPEAVSADQTAD